MKGSYLEATTQAQHRSGESFGYACNFVQFGHATLSIFALQLWVILLCNKQFQRKTKIRVLQYRQYGSPYWYSLLGSSRGIFYFSIFSRAYSTAWITKFEKETSLPVIASLTLSMTSIGKRIVLFSLSLRFGLISNAILHTSFNTKCIANDINTYAPT